MRKILKFFTSKTIIFSLILILQLLALFFLIYLLTNDSKIGIYAHFVFQVLSFFIVLYIVSNNDSINFKVTWLIVVLAFPIFGTFFYLFYHQNNIKKSTVKKYHNSVKKRKSKIPTFDTNEKEITYLNSTGWQEFRNTKSFFLASGAEKLSYLLNDLKNAKKFIFLEYFIIAKGEMFDQIFDILIKKASEGVEVKVIYDDFGSADRLPFNFRKKMLKKNIEVVAFNKMRLHINFAMNYRSHRKIVVIDNMIGYTGGINIGDEYINKKIRYGHWHDTALRIEGDAVSNLLLSFLEDWNFTSKNKLSYEKYDYAYKGDADGTVIPFSETPIDLYQTTRDVFLYLINQAKEEILITTPYLIIDNEIMTALKLAAQTGIKIKIIIPNIPDKKLVYMVTESYASELIDYDVEIYKYTPGFIHSKLMLIDKKKAVIGTTNLDFRSLYLHFENNIYLKDTKSINDITEFFAKTLAVSSLSTKETFKKKGIIKPLLQAILKSFASIL